MMLGKGLDSIVVKLSFEEVHVKSGHVLLWKALTNSMKGCRTLFRKCRVCSWKLYSCLFNIKYIFFEKHKPLWKNQNIVTGLCVYIYNYIYIHGSKCNNIMQNSLQASKSLMKTHSCKIILCFEIFGLKCSMTIS